MQLSAVNWVAEKVRLKYKKPLNKSHAKHLIFQVLL